MKLPKIILNQKVNFIFAPWLQSNSLYNSGKYIGNFFLDRGQISDYPDLNKIIDPKFVTDLFNTNPE
jgi:hypothetical protein